MRRRAVFTQISIVTVLCVLLLLFAYVCVYSSNCKIEPMPMTLDDEELDMMREQYTYKIKSDCLRKIRKMNMSIRLILIDEDMLYRLYVGCPRNSHPVHVGVDKKDVAAVNQSEYPTIKFVPFEDLETKDFLTETGPRIVRSNVFIPHQVGQFLDHWHRSKLISCKNLDMKRNPNMTVSMPPEAVRDIVWLRDLLYQFRVHPMLNGGTLLGEFKNDSLELTVKYPGGTPIDIFVLYREGNTSWVGGCDSELNKYKYTYSLIDEVCSADLLGHQFFVPCNAKDVIDAEYGNWTIDHLT